ncbi:DUF2199 domain-containing protein [Shimia sagamensis]|uniref:DUF2199 domain-containing protein n=1 Tax=Shimia sagamensis TaxID=1566352 RepID=A0ABY1PAY6_9RHOB|nr:DUF2199 domain-containing protein [Shimia sagamensis]SMP30434.1 hypothetical protein SAMN06265373_10746 [Shimia sagamensis]
MNLLALDSRWQRFNDENWVCPCCGQTFSGVFDIGFDHPDCWPHDSPRDLRQSELQVGDDKLSGDLCRFQEHRFLCSLLSLPIKGSDEALELAVWASVTPDTFYRYIDFATGETLEFASSLASLMNDLPLFGNVAPIGCEIRQGEEGQRPRLFAIEGPLAQAQAEGISFDQLLDIYAATGTEVRAHLMG